MSTTTMRRRVAALAAGALGAGALAFVASAPAAQAADAAPTPVTGATLTWSFSPQANSWGIATTGNVVATNPTVGADFTTATGFSLGDGSGSFDPATNTGEVDFSGSVTYSPFAAYGSLVPDKSTVTFADFELDIASATRGSLTAKVSYHKPRGDLAATEATIANFDISSLSVDGNGQLALQTAAPDWANVTAGTGNPGAATYYDSWPTSLVSTMRTNTEAGQDISVYFYRTGNTAGNTNKIPAAFSATGSLRTVAPTVTYADRNATVAVSGSYFSPTNGTNPSSNGIYVGVAEAGGLPDVSTSAGMANFAGVNYVPNAGIVNGRFSTSFTLDKTKLDSTKSYSVYTWRAHTHAETTQDSETPVSITWNLLTAAPVLSASVTSASYAGGLKVGVTGSGYRGVTLAGDDGVYVGLAVAGGLPDVSSQEGIASFVTATWIPASAIVDGALSTTLSAATSALDPTKSYAVYTWQAHGHSNTTQDTESGLAVDWSKLAKPAVTPAPIIKVAPAIAPKLPKSAKATKKLSVTYALGAKATGSVKVTFKKGKKKVVKTVTLVNGKATVKLTKKQVKKLGKGTWTITSTYAGNTYVKASSKTGKLKVK